MVFMKEQVYLETSVVSYYASRSSNNVIVLAKQRITEQWWPEAVNRFEIFISEAVVEEAAAGDPEASAKRLGVLEGFAFLDIDEQVQSVSEFYVQRLAIPPKAQPDAVHLAVASVHGMDYLVTWNCKHIANGEIIKKLLKINTEMGLTTPVIVTPEELME